MAKKSNTPVYAAALLLLLGAVGFLVYSGLSENSVYFLNVSEALAMKPDQLQSARLFGTVASGGITHPSEGPGVSFQLQDKDNTRLTVPVAYKGAVPDTFKPGVEVIVEGDFHPNGFDAHTLMTKCPSKYQKENRES